MSCSMATYYAKTHPEMGKYRGYPPSARLVNRVIDSPLAPYPDIPGNAGPPGDRNDRYLAGRAMRAGYRQRGQARFPMVYPAALPV